MANRLSSWAWARGLASAMVLVGLCGAAQADTVLYSNGFEFDTSGWNSTARVTSGTGGVTSDVGSFHANTDGTNTYTTWGGYNFGAGNAVPTAFQEYKTSVSIYLDVNGGAANDTRFDFSSAINKSDGTHRRDFIFNAGFYNDATGPGANTNRFVISAGNNSQPGSAYAKDPGHSPIAISTTGWYTFQHHFYDNAGVLAVDLSIFDSSNVLVNTWTLSNPTDLIAGIGGNRYGWFDCNGFGSTLAFDNTSLTVMTVVPLPSAALAGFGTLVGVGGLAAVRRRRLRA